MNYSELIEKAKLASEFSYSKYSGFAVGAALLCKDGSIFTGANCENASYSATICAERSAFLAAVSCGKREFSAIAVYAKTEPYPCGICLQFMSEFVSDDFLVIVQSNSKTEEYYFNELFPKKFILKEQKND